MSLLHVVNGSVAKAKSEYNQNTAESEQQVNVLAYHVPGSGTEGHLPRI